MSTHSSGELRLIERMRALNVPQDACALWFLGQNGFLVRTTGGTLIAIDPYLTDGCATLRPKAELDLSRCLPIPLQPEKLTVDAVLLTHSHADHLDRETISRLPGSPRFVAPWQSAEHLRSLGIAAEHIITLHPHQQDRSGDVVIEGTFALPTDATDLSHMGFLLRFDNGLSFYNTGDTAYAETLATLLPQTPDLCAICINGRFGNLTPKQAAEIVRAIDPAIAIPTHYDMLVCNRTDPELFRSALESCGARARMQMLSYDEPWIYRKEAR